MTVKKYSLKKDGATRLNDFLKVSEFRSGDDTDAILISDKLPPALAKIKEILKKEFGIEVSRVHINSGYRTPAYDRREGGSGSGPHTRGWAADFHMTSGGKSIPSIFILCAAQMLGIKGIERIRDGVSVHIDVERGDRWWSYQKQINGRFQYVTLPDFFTTSWAKAAGVKRPAAAKGNPTLKKGDKGEAVKKLQKALKITVDGAFGAGTEKAVKACQKKNGLAADGVVGPATWEKIL